MKKDLKGHRAVVTGASSGLGEEFARQLAVRGADLVIAARRVEKLQSLAEKLKAEHGISVDVIQSDLSRSGAARALYDAAVAGGPVTILINNAGASPFNHFMLEDADKHVGTIQLNSVSLTELCHYFTGHMLAHKRRSYVTNVGSIASFQGVPRFSVYSGTKAYVRMFSEVLAHELKGTNVTVTCLCPGGTYTEFSAAAGQVLKDGSGSVMMTAEAVVNQGMKGMLKGCIFVVPGFVNKLAVFLPRLIPSGLAMKAAALAMDRSAGVAAKPNGNGETRARD